MDDAPIRLNIGAGATIIEGWTAIDRRLGSEAYPLAGYADGTVEEIRASHILEHFSFDEVPKVLAEWARVLKPGGRLRIAVPDINKIIALTDDPLRERYLMGGQTDENDYHRSAFNPQTLSNYLQEAGLESIRPWASENTDTASNPISLNLEGIRAGGPQPQSIKICAAMSIPRVGWNDNWGCVINALRPFNIPVKRCTGAFWGQCMQSLFERAVGDGVDWILSIDYDSMFTANDIDRLFGVFGANPHIDALAALQVRRSSDFPLLGVIDGAGGFEIDGTPLKVDSAHFGLTLIRTESLQRLSKPWFHSVPDEDGRWSIEKKIDDDTYFWKKWREVGNTLYIDPGCRIGHLQLMVSEFGEDMKARHIHVQEWHERNEAKHAGGSPKRLYEAPIGSEV